MASEILAITSTIWLGEKSSVCNKVIERLYAASSQLNITVTITTANESTLFAVVIVTVTLSVVLHGMTAGPAARWYGSMSQQMGECEENRPVSDEPFAGPPG